MNEWNKYKNSVYVGMSREELLSRLGVPDNVARTTKKRRTPSCYKYGNVEFHFGDRKSDGLVFVYMEDTEGNGFTLLK